MTNHNAIEIDPLLQALGPVGLFACVQFFIYIIGYMSDAYQFSNYVFTAQDVNHRCAAPSNNSDGMAGIIPELHGDWMNTTVVDYGQCFISVSNNVSGDVTEYPCVYGIEYDAPEYLSFVSEFDLVCEKKALAGLTQTVLQLGIGVGSIFWPWLSDLYGRKRIIVIGLSLMILASISAGLAPNYPSFVVLKFTVGLIYPGTGLIGVIAAVELIPTSHRAFTCCFCSNLFWVVCLITMPLFAFLLRFHSWRTLQMMCSGAAGLVIIYVFAKEPVRWLVANGKIKEAERVLTTAARWNGKDPDTILTIFRQLVLRQHQSAPIISSDGNSAVTPANVDEIQDELLIQETNPVSTQPDRVGFCDLFRHKILRRNTLVTLFIWFVDCLTYNALYLMSGSLAFGVYTSFALNAAVEGASCFLIILMMSRVGRRVTIGVFHVMAGVGLIISGVCFSFQYNSSLQLAGTVTSLVGKMGMGGAYFTVFYYTPEIFPTNIRNRANWDLNDCSNSGGMVAPYSDVLADYAVWAPGVLFGTLSICVVFGLLVMPENKGRELPQTIRDLEAWYHVTSSSDNEVDPNTETPI